MSAPPRPLIGWLAAAGVIVIWSAWVVISRLGVVQSLTIYDMAAVRFLVAAVAVSPLLLRYWPRQLALWKIGLLSLGPGVPYALFAFAGMQHAPASHAALLMNGTLPIFAAILGRIWLGDRPGIWKAVGMAVIMSGCALVNWKAGGAGVDPTGAWRGHLLLLAAALAFAAYLTATKLWDVSPLQAMVSIPAVNLAWFGPIYLCILPKGIGAAPPFEILLQGLYQGLGPSILGVVLFTVAVRAIGPVRTAAALAGVPGLVALLAIPVLGEWPGAPVWIGLILTTVGIVLTAGWTPRRLSTIRIVG